MKNLTTILITLITMTLLLSLKVSANSPETPEITSITSNKASITVSWNEVSDAKRYYLYYKTQEEKDYKIIDTALSSYKIRNLKQHTIYHVAVYALLNDNTYACGKTIYTSTTPEKPKITGYERSHTSLLVEMKNVSHVQGYEVYLRKKSTAKWSLVEEIPYANIETFELNDLKPGTAYYIGIRSYREDSLANRIRSDMFTYKVRTYKNLALKKVKTKAKFGTSQVKRKGTYNKTYGIDVVRMINRERKKKGLTSLKWDETLYKCAKIRCKEITKKYGHPRPNGSICGTISEVYDGENIVKNCKSPITAHIAWINSPKHYENVVLPKYTRAAVACFKYRGRNYWVTGFGY